METKSFQSWYLCLSNLPGVWVFLFQFFFSAFVFVSALSILCVVFDVANVVDGAIDVDVADEVDEDVLLCDLRDWDLRIIWKKIWKKIGRYKQHTLNRLQKHKILKLEHELEISESKIIWKWSKGKLSVSLNNIIKEKIMLWEEGSLKFIEMLNIPA